MRTFLEGCFCHLKSLYFLQIRIIFSLHISVLKLFLTIEMLKLMTFKTNCSYIQYRNRSVFLFCWLRKKFIGCYFRKDSVYSSINLTGKRTLVTMEFHQFFSRTHFEVLTRSIHFFRLIIIQMPITNSDNIRLGMRSCVKMFWKFLQKNATRINDGSL